MKYMKSIMVLFLLLGLVIPLNQVSATNVTDNEYKLSSSTLKVITTVSIIEDWVWQVGKGVFNPVSIVSGLEDTHTFEMTAEQIQLLSEADFLIRFGYEGLEEWLEPHIETILADNPSLVILELIDEEDLIEDPFLGDHDEDHDDHAQLSLEHDHHNGNLNPHVWMSPELAKKYTLKINDTLSTVVDPQNAAKYTANTVNYLLDLDRLLDKIEKVYKPKLAGLKVIEHHPAFIYLLELLDIERFGVIEDESHHDPDAKRMAELSKTIEDNGVDVIITQPQMHSDAPIQLAQDTGAKISVLTPLLGVLGLNSYISMIEYNIYALQNPESPDAAPFSFIAILGGVMFLGVISIFVNKRKRA